MAEFEASYLFYPTARALENIGLTQKTSTGTPRRLARSRSLFDGWIACVGVDAFPAEGGGWFTRYLPRGVRDMKGQQDEDEDASRSVPGHCHSRFRSVL